MMEDARFQIEFNQSSHDEKAVEAFYRVSYYMGAKGRIWFNRGVYIVFGVLGITIGVMGLILLWLRAQITVLQILLFALSVYMVAGGCRFIYKGIFFYRTTARRVVKQQTRLKLAKDGIIYFTEDKIIDWNETSESRYDYSSVSDLCEWDHYLAIFLDEKRVRGLFMDETCLTGGTPAELHQFLSEKTGLQGKKLH